MTSKTFESIDQTRQLHVKPLDKHVTLVINYKDAGRSGLTISHSDAPALALAILEAAGVVPIQRDYESYDDGTPAHLQAVTYFLKQHNEAQERATAEARERAELEAEALELCNAYRKSFLHCAPEDGFDGFDDPERIKAKWLAVARRARELAKEATK